MFKAIVDTLKDPKVAGAAGAAAGAAGAGLFSFGRRKLADRRDAKAAAAARSKVEDASASKE